jgi:predicted HD phosphohydrolase
VTTLSIDEIEELLASGAATSAAPTHSPLQHALQTAADLRRQFPSDDELAVAGLVHDIGSLLPGVGDAEHARAGAAAVREALGERVATLVGMHVEAKRYLVASEATYEGALDAASVVSLARQGGPMSPEEQVAFADSPYAADAVVLRRADENGKVAGLVVAGLGEWMQVVRRVHLRAG